MVGQPTPSSSICGKRHPNERGCVQGVQSCRSMGLGRVVGIDILDVSSRLSLQALVNMAMGNLQVENQGSSC